MTGTGKRFLHVDGEPPREQDLYAVFRTRIPRKGKLKIAMAGFFRLFFDGRELAWGPVKSGDPLYFYDEFAFDRPGTVAIEVHTFRSRPEIALDFDGGQLTWKAHYLHSFLPDAPYMVGNMGFSEYFDYSQSEDFAGAGVDDSGWAEAESSESPANFRFEPRPIPYFCEEKRLPVSLTENADGSILADFGEMFYGRLTVSGNGIGSLAIGFIEDLTHGWANGSPGGVMYSDRLFALPGEFSYKNFNKRGFRYVKLTPDGDFSLAEIFVSEYAFPGNFTGNFRSSDDRLNRLFAISKRTLALCMDDIYNDCPHRDQAQWMDAFISAQTAFYLCGDTALARKAILQHAVCSFKDGLFCSPSITGNVKFVDYALVLVLFTGWYCKVSNDRSILPEIMPNCEANVETFRRWRDPADGLLKDADQQGMVFLDNAFELCRRGKSAGLNALYYAALKTMAELETLSGGDPASYEQEARQLKESYRKCFEKPDGTLRDSDEMPLFSCRHLNFSCEFGDLWQSSHDAKAVFRVFCQKPEKRRISAGAYGKFRMTVNGRTELERTASASWSKPAPCYRMQQKEVELRTGENTIEFSVEWNFINWELFFSGLEDSDCRISLDSVSGSTKSVNPKYWEPPELSQTTHGYAAYCKLADAGALRRTLAEHYYRDYLSVRVPLFSEITGDPEKLSGWILPVNNPCPAFFYLSAMFDNGMKKEALGFLRKAWGVMLDGNAVNTWEEWNWNSSLCHAWSASPAYFLLRYVLGVNLDRSAERIVLLAPDLQDLAFAEGTVALSPSECMTVSVRRTAAGELKTDYSVPDGWKVIRK